MNRRIVTQGLVMIAGLFLLGLFLSHYMSTHWIEAHVVDHGPGGEVLYLLLGAAFVAVGLSRQFVAFLGGYAFGFGSGILFALLASLLGCWLAFAFGRYAARWLRAGRLSGRIAAIDRFIQRNPFNMTLLFRLLPVGSNLLVNLAAGVSSVRPLPFFLGTAFGYLPQTLIFVLLGSGIHLQPVLRTSVSVLLFIASSALGIYLYRRYRDGRLYDNTEVGREVTG